MCTVLERSPGCDRHAGRLEDSFAQIIMRRHVPPAQPFGKEGAEDLQRDAAVGERAPRRIFGDDLERMLVGGNRAAESAESVAGGQIEQHAYGNAIFGTFVEIEQSVTACLERRDAPETLGSAVERVRFRSVEIGG